jgi:cytochrome P450
VTASKEVTRVIKETTDFVYDPFSPEVMSDPLPYYRVLRDEHPVYYMPKYDMFAVSRFQDIYDLLSDASDAFLSTEGSLPAPTQLMQHNQGAVPDPPTDAMSMHTAYSSEVHGAIRQAHGKPLRPRPVARMEDQVRSLVRDKLAELLPLGRFDAVQDFAGFISAAVACTLFRLPISDAPTIQDAVNSATKTDPVSGGVDMSVIKTKMTELCLPVIEQRRAEGADGSFPLVDGLLNFRLADGRALADEEIALQFVGLIVGAAETLPKIFGHGLMELDSHPEQQHAVRVDVDTNARIALEEMLRFCGPAQWFARTVRKPTEVAGQPVWPGQRLIALIQSGNRDPREFDEPEEFRWDRRIERTLAFGRGPHMCIGLHLARLEGRILLEEWCKAVPDYEVEYGEAVRRPSSFQWGWTSVPVRVGGGHV